MKLINIINSYSSEGDAPRFYFKADTALLRNNDAFYIPDGMGRVVAQPHIVLKLSRLAKCISERFASRCVEVVMGGVTFTPVEMLEELRREGLPWDAAVGFDHSSALSLESVGRDAMLQGARFCINNEEVLTLSVSDMRFTPDKIISSLSEATTLRIGDLVYLGAPESFDIKVGDNLKLYIGDTLLLNFDIK
ncbi:MAG: fumarylacetoacetate hydrolase family protein [Alistipes sp.]|nr:fumarylacetoacetate hydrolase family protein [Alistipes sp.]